LIIHRIGIHVKILNRKIGEVDRIAKYCNARRKIDNPLKIQKLARRKNIKTKLTTFK